MNVLRGQQFPDTCIELYLHIVELFCVCYIFNEMDQQIIGALLNLLLNPSVESVEIT